MALLGCPQCGDTDNLLSVELIKKAYPVEVEEHAGAPAGAAMSYKINTPAQTWDDAPEPTGKIHCGTCGRESTRGDLVVPPPTDL